MELKFMENLELMEFGSRVDSDSHFGGSCGEHYFS